MAIFDRNLGCRPLKPPVFPGLLVRVWRIRATKSVPHSRCEQIHSAGIARPVQMNKKGSNPLDRGLAGLALEAVPRAAPLLLGLTSPGFSKKIQPLVSTSQDQSLEKAIVFILAHQNAGSDWINIDTQDSSRADGWSFITEQWWPLVADPGNRTLLPTRLHHRYLKLCVIPQVANELKSGTSVRL